MKPPSGGWGVEGGGRGGIKTGLGSNVLEEPHMHAAVHPKY